MLGWKKKCKELEEENLKLTSENSRLKSDKAILECKIEEITRIKETTPEDCVPGKWCRSCEFGKCYSYYIGGTNHPYGTRRWTDYICTKGESCKNFVDRKDKE